MVKHSAETATPMNASVAALPTRLRLDQPVLEALMVTLGVVMPYVFGNGPTQRCVPDNNHPTQAFILDRAHKLLGVRVYGDISILSLQN
jgi:hypothetical protein